MGAKTSKKSPVEFPLSSTSAADPANWNGSNDYNRNVVQISNTPTGFETNSTNTITGTMFVHPTYYSTLQNSPTSTSHVVPAPSINPTNIENDFDYEFDSYLFEADTARAIRLSLLDNNNANRESVVTRLPIRLPPSTLSEIRRNDVASALSTTSQCRGIDVSQEKQAKISVDPPTSKEMTFDCSICMEFNDQDVIVVTECGHVFHKNCVTPWIQSAGNCPTCRVRITVTALRKVFVTVSSNNNASPSTIASTEINASKKNNKRNRNNKNRINRINNDNVNGGETNSRGASPIMFSRSIWLSLEEKQMTATSLTTYIAQRFHMASQNVSIKRLSKNRRCVTFKINVDTKRTFDILKDGDWPETFRVREFFDRH